MPTRLARTILETARLMTSHPPRIANANKQLVFDIACNPSVPHRGSLTVTRWRADGLPVEVDPEPRTRLEVRADLLPYDPSPEGALAWHLNFADRRLFVAYGSALLAQDEMQVAEHPALGALCEFLATKRDTPFAPFTRDENDVPTPYLVRDVERRCAIATDPDVEEDRPYGLYGNRFARATADTIRRATKAIVPPTISHILAMEAIPGGRGVYSLAEIRDALLTAYTGFAAARTESLEAGARETHVHTGHWGTGAYGGNRELMALLQLAAARLARIDALVFHAHTEPGMAPWIEARALLDRVAWPACVSGGVDAMIHAVHARAFEWGFSDGN
jgi:hypothetical protein